MIKTDSMLKISVIFKSGEIMSVPIVTNLSYLFIQESSDM